MFESWSDSQLRSFSDLLRGMTNGNKIINKGDVKSGMKIYVAGPYTKGYVPYNVRDAIDAAEELAQAGHFPYVPHLSMYWDIAHPHPYEYWMALDDVFLRCCDAVVRIPGLSSGADAEVKVARSLGMPVYFSVEEFLKAQKVKVGA